MRSAAPEPGPTEGQVAVAGDTSADAEDADGGEGTASPLTTPTPPANPLVVGSFALLGLGLVLFGLRIAARRLR
jgi:hypothetical protein